MATGPLPDSRATGVASLVSRRTDTKGRGGWITARSRRSSTRLRVAFEPRRGGSVPMPTGTWDTQSGASRSTAPAARDRRLRSAERVGGGGKRRPDVQLGYRREASHGRRHGELEAQAAGGGGGPHALELGLARGARRVWVRQRAHDEPLGSGAVEAGRGCRAAAAGPSRAGTGGEAPAGLRSSRAGSPDAGRVRRRRAPGSTCRAGLGAAAAGPGSARNARGHPAHDEPRCVDLTVRMHRLAAPGSGHEGEYRAHSDIGDSRHGPNRARRGLRTGRGHALGRAARRRRTRRSMIGRARGPRPRRPHTGRAGVPGAVTSRELSPAARPAAVIRR